MLLNAAGLHPNQIPYLLHADHHMKQCECAARWHMHGHYQVFRACSISRAPLQGVLTTQAVCGLQPSIRDMPVSGNNCVLGLVQVNSQTIHLVHVHPAGQLIPLQTIGQHCFPDDDLILAHQAEQESAWRHQHQACSFGPTLCP